MAKSKADEPLLPSLRQSGSSLTPYRSPYSSNAALTKDGQHIIHEGEKHELMITVTTEKAIFAASKVSELIVHASSEFADTCTAIDATRDKCAGTASQEYANAYSHHLKDQAARHYTAIIETAGGRMRADVDRPLPLTAPEEKRKGFVARVLGA